jgi:hypothetical protein
MFARVAPGRLTSDRDAPDNGSFTEARLEKTSPESSHC